MGTETIDLQISDARIRVICENPASSALLRLALADHLIEERSEPGFVLKNPDRKGGLHILLDRSGFVLGRTRTSEECVAILGSHLAAMVPPPTNTTRIHMRALIGNDSLAVLAAFPLFASPPLVERRLERASHRVIDRLAVDIAPNGVLEMSPTPWPALADLHRVAGHASAPDEAFGIAAILVPHGASARPSLAAAVSFIASTVSTHATQHDRIALAEELAAAKVISVDANERSARYAALSR